MTLLLNRTSVAESPELLGSFLRLVQEDIKFLRGSYPNFDDWFTTKVLPGIINGERTLVLEERAGVPAGLLILKHTAAERKLCTLRVRPEYEYRGLGVRLFSTAFEILETDHPLLSVSEVAFPKFAKVFDHFGFACEAAYQGLYLPRVQEFSFNGILKWQEESSKAHREEALWTPPQPSRLLFA